MNGLRRESQGFTLVELLVALAITTILVTGVVQLALAATGGYRLQQDLSAMQENARFALQMITREAEAAGFRPQPWLEEGRAVAISPDAVEHLNASSDQVAFTRRSRRNCFANDNPVTDASGAPRHDLLETAFRVTASGSLSQTCRYGPDRAGLVTQINRLGLVQNVEALQALYAEDTDGDGNADHWVRAGAWTSESQVLGLEVAVLIASPTPFGAPAHGAVSVLDETVATPDDGRLRRVYTTAMAIKGRSG